jgi:putative proteasome-type protease
MTYCLSLLCEEGLVFLSDSRSNAGIDNIAVHRKMHIFEQAGERVICLQSSGNLSLTHSVLALVEEDIMASKMEPDTPHLLNQKNLFETARYIGAKIREISDTDRSYLERDDFKFNIHFLVGGQIKNQAHGIFYVYPQGNVMHASVDSPFLQIGESKYGKPILDRGFRYDMQLGEAVKFGVLSMDSTMKSNLSVGPPIDVFSYEKNSLRVQYRCHLDDNSEYLQTIRKQWGEGLKQLVTTMPQLEWKS